MIDEKLITDVIVYGSVATVIIAMIGFALWKLPKTSITRSGPNTPRQSNG